MKATAEDLQQEAVCGCLCNSDGQNASKSFKQQAVQQLRGAVGPVDVIFEEKSQQNAIVERANCEPAEKIDPCVSGASLSETSSDTRSEDPCN